MLSIKNMLVLLGGSGAAAPAAPANAIVPAIAGTNEVGETATRVPGTWTGTPDLSVTWERDGTPIAGETGDTYVFDAADAGTEITVTEHDAVSGTSATSAPITVYWSAPVLDTPADSATVYDLTPDLAFTKPSGYTGDMEVEIRAVLLGEASDTGISSSPYTADAQVNFSTVKWTFRAVNGKWATARTLTVSAAELWDQFSTDQADVDARTCDIAGALDGVGNVSAIDVASGILTVNTSANNAFVYNNVTTARALGKIVKIADFVRTSGDTTLYMQDTKAAKGWATALVGIRVNNPKYVGDKVRAVLVAAAASPIPDAAVLMPLPSGGAAYFVRISGLWRFVYRARRDATASLYASFIGEYTVNSSIGEVLITTLNSGTFASGEFDWADLYTTEPALNTVYDGVADGCIQVTWDTVAGETYRLKYRYYDDDNYHYIEASGGTIVAKKRVAGTDTNYASAISYAAAYSDGNRIMLGVSLLGVDKYFQILNITTDTYLTAAAGVTNADAFNQTNAAVVVSGESAPFELFYTPEQAARYADLDLTPSTAAAQVLPKSAGIETAVTYDTDKAAFLYRNNNLYGTTYDIVSIDLTGATVVRVGGSLGRPKPAWDGTNLYIASSDPAYLSRFNGTAAQIIGSLPQNIAQHLSIGDDGLLYIGMYPNGGLVVYNQGTGVISDLGRADNTTSITQYLYTLEVDTDYAWCGLGEAPWYLVRYRLSDGDRQIYFEGDASTDVGGNVYRTVAGTAIYYERIDSSSAHTWYLLTGGTPTLVDVGDVPPLVPWYSSGGVTLVQDDANWEFDLSEASAYLGHNPTIQWRAAGSGDPLSSVTPTGIKLANITIGNLKDLFGDGSFYCYGNFYDGIWKIAPDISSSTFLGATPYNLYDWATIDSSHALIGAYPSSVQLWDAGSAYTLNDGSPDISLTNPGQVLSASKYPYFVMVGDDGLYYAFHTHVRDSVGGELSWYDPGDQSTGSLRTPFLDWSPRGMCWCDGKIVVSGNSLSGADGAIFVVDPTTHTVENTWTITGAPNGGNITPVSTTDVVGIAVGSTFAYRVNILTGAVGWSVTLPYNAWGTIPYTRARIFNDGTALWLTMNHDVYSIDPTDGSETKLADSDGDYNVLIYNDIAYTYYGTTINQYPLS